MSNLINIKTAAIGVVIGTNTTTTQRDEIY